MGKGRMIVVGALLLAACSACAACAPATSGGVNSPSATIAHDCAAAAAAGQRVDQAATLAAPALVALGVPQAKVDQIVAGIRRGELAVTATCAIVQIVVPPPGGAAAGGSATVQPII